MLAPAIDAPGAAARAGATSGALVATPRAPAPLLAHRRRRRASAPTPPPCAQPAPLLARRGRATTTTARAQPYSGPLATQSSDGSGSLMSSIADDDNAPAPRTSADDSTTTPPGQALMDWLALNDAPQPNLELCPFPDAAAFSGATAAEPATTAADVAVARVALQPGDLALSVPERLVLTLGRVVGSDELADKLTSGKLSELSVLSLVLAYEKKSGRKSRWRPLIRALDRQRARSAAAGGAESPLLWNEGEAARLLQGSPVVGQVEARLQGIRDEYEQLDTIWFMVS
jgi:hypothetical protein